MQKHIQQIERYLSKYPRYNAVVHAVGGIGVGVLIARPLVGTHPVRWGLMLLVLSVLAHLKPLMMKK